MDRDDRISKDEDSSNTFDDVKMKNPQDLEDSEPFSVS